MLELVFLPRAMAIVPIHIDSLEEMSCAGMTQLLAIHLGVAKRVAPERDKSDLNEELEVPIEW